MVKCIHDMIEIGEIIASFALEKMINQKYASVHIVKIFLLIDSYIEGYLSIVAIGMIGAVTYFLF